MRASFFPSKRESKCAENRRPSSLSVSLYTYCEPRGTCRNISPYEIFLQMRFRRDQWKLLVIPEYFLYSLFFISVCASASLCVILFTHPTRSLRDRWYRIVRFTCKSNDISYRRSGGGFSIFYWSVI